ncbi:MAG: hypothetical protein M1829_002193 [Trizodia sp. TS-e1964]|nr:MAG: hypothetical protein M1829_002193 [Trizodia sp. TS-e1964]
MAQPNLNGESEKFPWHIGAYDAHCHPTEIMEDSVEISSMKMKGLIAMASRAEDQELVAKLQDLYGFCPYNFLESDGTKIIPCFGWHPWFSHQLYDDISNPRPIGSGTFEEGTFKIAHYQSVLTGTKDVELLNSLPDPRPLSAFIAETKIMLRKFPLAMVGEIGLDRTFRLPEPAQDGTPASSVSTVTPGGREGRKLSPHRVMIEHQQNILKAQLNLAGEMGRAVSIHGVQAHGAVFEVLQETWKGHELPSKRHLKRKADAVGARWHDANSDSEQEDTPKPFPPRICLHSYSGPPETLKQYFHPSVPATIFFSFSSEVNFSSTASARTAEVIRAVPDHQILAESDFHCAGAMMDQLLEEGVRNICKIKGWELETGLITMRDNWKRFVLGDSILK